MCDVEIARLVRGYAELESVRETIKLKRCPHCGAAQTLNAHGFLRGFAEGGSDRILRGRRFFCSNRYRKRGCGRTFSIELAEFIARFVVTALTLWKLVKSSAVASVYAAIRDSGFAGARSNAYRLLRRFRHLAPSLRALCLRKAAVSQEATLTVEGQLVAHLEAVFASYSSPLFGVQLEQNKPLFGR